jgi:hypothetical protein
VGDSFTFGDWVADTETWPAYLERMLGVKVYNAGVSSYGFDQTVLRLERLIPQLKPTIVIASLIEDDISRTEVSSRSNAAKPFFRIENGGLLLDPEPLLPFPKDDRESIRALLKSSALLRLVFRRWLYPEIKEHDDGLAVSCALTRRLAEIQHRYAVPILLLAQMDEELHRHALLRLQRCAEGAGLEVIDTYPALAEVRDASPERWELCWNGHMTAAGNRIVAKIVYDYVQSLQSRILTIGDAQKLYRRSLPRC